MVKIKTKKKQKTISSFKFSARIHEILDNEAFSTALIFFFSSFFILSMFPFYWFPFIIILSLILAFLSTKSPPLAIILEYLLVLPSIAFHSSILAWLFLIPLTLCFIFAFKRWDFLAFMALLVSSQFMPINSNLSIIGIMLFPFFLTSAISYLGSKNSVLISVFSVILIMFLQSIWSTSFNVPSIPMKNIDETPAFLDIKDITITSNTALSGISVAFSNMANMEQIKNFGEMLVFTLSRIFSLFASDNGFIILFSWIIALFLASILPATFSRKTKYAGVIGTIPLYIICAVVYLIHQVISNEVVIVFLSTFFSTFLIAILNFSGISISREKTINLQSRAKKFGKFGVEDMATMDSNIDSLDDVGGYDAVKRELIEAIKSPLTDKEISFAYGLKPAKGLLLFGPPGTGKTLIISALAKELDYSFFYVKASELISQWAGESEKNVGELFEEAKKNAPCLLFFDELEIIGKSRNKYTSDDHTPKILGRLLQEMDGVKTKKQVIVIGATNMPDILDTALLRPGRLNKIIYMPTPDFASRKSIFKLHTLSIPLADDVDISKLAKITNRYTGADIKNICDEAKQLAARRARESGNVEDILQEDFETVIEFIKPSVTNQMLEEYEEFKLKFERAILDKEKKQIKKQKQIEWSDVVGLSHVKKSLLETIEFPLLYEDEMNKFDIKASKGILLFGPPGCGKTMIVKAAASELDATFLSISGADLLKKGVSNIQEIIKDTFFLAKDKAPSIIFIDEIETIAPSRKFSTGGAVSQLLIELDGVKELKKVVLIGATNRPDRLDDAILRPGRFDKIFYIPPPDFESRMDLFKKNLKGEFDVNVDFQEIANLTQGFSGADLHSICQTVKMKAFRKFISNQKKGIITISNEDVKEVILKRKPSVTRESLAIYNSFVDEYGERV